MHGPYRGGLDPTTSLPAFGGQRTEVCIQCRGPKPEGQRSFRDVPEATQYSVGVIIMMFRLGFASTGFRECGVSTADR